MQEKREEKEKNQVDARKYIDKRAKSILLRIKIYGLTLFDKRSRC